MKKLKKEWERFKKDAAATRHYDGQAGEQMLCICYPLLSREK